VHQSRNQALQQLALAEHDRGLVAEARRDPVESVGGLTEPNEPREQEGAAGEQRACDGDRGCESDGAAEALYPPLAFLISPEIAGTISCKSPITA
jgi:hypothetical protein